MNKRIQVIYACLALVVPSIAMSSDAQTTYKLVCASCHDSSVSSAPKLNDKHEWKDRLAQGMDSLYESTVNGKCEVLQQLRSDLTKDDIKAAVDYMVTKVQ
jgi:cytochrome c5